MRTCCFIEKDWARQVFAFSKVFAVDGVSLAKDFVNGSVPDRWVLRKTPDRPKNPRTPRIPLFPVWCRFGCHPSDWRTSTLLEIIMKVELRHVKITSLVFGFHGHPFVIGSSHPPWPMMMSRSASTRRHSRVCEGSGSGQNPKAKKQQGNPPLDFRVSFRCASSRIPAPTQRKDRTWRRTKSLVCVM